MVRGSILDTYSLVKRFIGSGFNEKQSETIVSAIAEMHYFDTSHLCTKSDLAQAESSIRTDMQAMESGIRTDMQAMESGIRTDMQTMESGIRADMKIMESNIRAEIADVRTMVEKSKNELLKWFICTSVALASVIIASIKLL